jgi:two-component system sensor histidine kinase AlgZ
MATSTRDTRPQSRSTLGYWGLQAAGWGCWYYAQATGEVIMAGSRPNQAAIVWGIFCLCGIALTHTLRWIIRQRGWLALPPWALLLRVSVATLLLGIALDAAITVMSQFEYHSAVVPLYAAFYRLLPHRNQLINQFIASFVLGVIWVGTYLSFALQRHRYRAQLRQSELAKALQAAELRLLKAQLNPHFLFNALNSVRALIADEPERAQEVVTRLARTLRYALGSGDEELVTFGRELEMINDYLALECVRFAQRLEIIRDIAPEASQVLVPGMLVQTLVENACKHGIAQLKQGGTVRIEGRLVGKELLLRVINPRPDNPIGPSAGEGTGLRNSAERLRLLFGERASLRLDLSTPGVAVAELRVPA